LLGWDARLAILHAGTSGPAFLLAFAGSLGTGAAICRLLVVGAGRPTAVVAGAPGELPRLPARAAVEATAAAPGGAPDAGARAASRALVGWLGTLTATAGRRVGPSLELNRVPLRALAVILLAGLALLAAGGAFGIDAAARAAGPLLPSPSPIVGG
jgi:hypothetical protein